MVEVLVAGGGPAGAVAALVLARRGVRVLLADAGLDPGVPGTITVGPGALAAFSAVGLASEVTAVMRPLAGLDLRRGPRRISLAGPGEMGLVAARTLGEGLRQAAARAGAQVREGVHVGDPLLDGAVVRGATLTDGTRRVRLPAAVTIAADGRGSMLARSLGLLHHPRVMRRRAVVARFAGMVDPPAGKELHLLREGWAAVTPLPDGEVLLHVVGSAGREGEAPLHAMRRLVASDPHLAARLVVAEVVGGPWAVGPVEAMAPRPGGPGVLLAGDAAGCVETLGGHGLHVAVCGGALAARVALAVLERPELAGHLELARRRHAAFGAELRMARAVRLMAGRPAGQRVLVALAGHVPAVGRAVLGGFAARASGCTVADRPASPRQGRVQEPS